jgi:hypothetical protein
MRCEGVRITVDVGPASAPAEPGSEADRRAKAVVAALLAAGAPADRLQGVGHAGPDGEGQGLSLRVEPLPAVAP